ncbi:MAG: LON peptidase substrate-binding domain-containing protein [Flavipsychrobacter sp.]|nr:LON peptidase substrate-binding domain-containing protein [Flavipsychrobacter sp.]
MTNFIPIFPLSIVVYPGEALNLHVFEPRYKQLISECIRDKKNFGITTVLDKKMEELGTQMEILEVVKEYDNGELDIKTRGVNVFRILEVIKTLPDKMYWGAIVNYPANVTVQDNTNIAKLILDEVKRLYTLVSLEEKFPIHKSSMISYEIGHMVGFTKTQEYELLGLFTESQRLEYIRRHLSVITPVIKELEQMKARVQMNGHFRNLSLGDLDL